MRQQSIEDDRNQKILHEEVLKLDLACKRKATSIKEEKGRKTKCENKGQDYIQKFQINKKLNK